MNMIHPLLSLIPLYHFCVDDLDECNSQWDFDLFFGKMMFVITIFPDGEHEIYEETEGGCVLFIV